MKKITLKTVAESLQKLTALVSEHNGSNGNAHLLVSVDTSGFMSADDKYQLDHKGNYALGLDANQSYDVLTLDTGVYVGRNFKNSPKPVDDSVCLVDVKGWKNDRRIDFYWLNANKQYTRMLYGDTDPGWIDGSWISLTPINGFAGTIQARQIPVGVNVQIEVRFALNCKFTSRAETQIAVLPDGYTFLNGIAISKGIAATVDSITNIPMNCILHQGNKLEIVRSDPNTDGTITNVNGQLNFNR